ncbi:hypothetical protein C8D93_1063 [Sinimarinibacterium flocculans]|uniref:Lipoprotein n=1 Tax=Sinimarinibacterium flocculans TaxID=985250 RepID=A0A318E6E9_9GAMM|nr:hypothetical protein C8D93_1063 [Sinimarinibacterium flocculans]
MQGKLGAGSAGHVPAKGRRAAAAVGAAVLLAGLAACGGSDPLAGPNPGPTPAPGPDAGPVTPVMRCAPGADVDIASSDCAPASRTTGEGVRS